MRVVENFDADPSRATWALSASPSLQIGSRDGDGPELFSTIRSAIRREDGSVVVIDGITNEVRGFDSAGAHLFTSGGNGEGPGEFRQASHIVGHAGDSLVVYDLFRGRLTLFGPDGTPGRTVELHAMPGFGPSMLTLGMTADRQVIVRGLPGPTSGGLGPVSVRGGWYLADLDRREMEQVGEIPVIFLSTMDDGTPVAVFPLLVPLAAASRSGVWSATGIEPELRFYGLDGELQLIARFPDQPRALSEADIDRVLKWYTSLLPASTPFSVHQYGPIFSNMIVDATGHVWVQESEDERDPESWVFAAPRGRDVWRVVNAEGVWVQSVTVPNDFKIMAIGDNYVLGVSTDDLGVESITVYDLTRR